MRWSTLVLFFGLLSGLSAPPGAQQPPQSVRLATIAPDGTLVVRVTEAGPATMVYTVQAEATAVYQCLGANQACPAETNRQDVTATTVGTATLKVVTTISQMVAGLTHGEVTATPPDPVLLCPGNTELEEASSATLMSVAYRGIVVHNTTKGTAGSPTPESLSATFHTCP